jgi:NTE family protein
MGVALALAAQAGADLTSEPSRLGSQRRECVSPLRRRLLIFAAGVMSAPARGADGGQIRVQPRIDVADLRRGHETAKIKIFPGKDLAIDHLVASTCLPLLMQAVEVDGEHYWDGSYAGNPAIFPLVYDCAARDILMIHVTPAERPGVPTTSPAIMNRMQEISFNTALIRAMRTIDRFNRLIDDGRLEGGKRILVHFIEADDLIKSISWWSRLNADWDFLMRLHDIGRARAEEWLDTNFDRVGVEATVDLQERYY